MLPSNIDTIGMTSRTPIRLTPHRGPLATPSTSAESSPTSPTPPADTSYCSTTIRPTLDVGILQHRISTLSPLARHQSRPRLYRRRREVAKQGLLGFCTHLYSLGLAFESLISSASELAKTVGGVVTFCLFIWGLLGWSSYASELRQPSLWGSISPFPLPFPTRLLPLHVNSSLYEPRDHHVAVLQFLSEQIQHAKALTSLSVGVGLPLRAFFDAHRATIPRVTVRHDLPEMPYHSQELDAFANLTEFLDPPLLEFTCSSFIGRSFTLALEELGDLILEPMVSHGSFTSGKHQDVHAHAIFWRTASNLLLEYSAARPRARGLLQHLHAIHQQSSLVLDYQAAGSVEGGTNIWRRKGAVRYPVSSVEDEMQAFLVGLEVTLDNVRRLIAYLDLITEQLAQTTLKDVLKIRHRTDLASCLILLKELFAQSKPSLPKKVCFCVDDYRIMPPARPERVGIMVPGSPTVRTDR